jgi:hypothetical protein
LWFDPSRANNNDMYVGVTVFEDSDGLPLAPGDIQEAFPRQQLLCAPFAERAQMAEYARQSLGDFTVNQTLNSSGPINADAAVTVDGLATLNGGAYLLEGDTLVDDAVFRPSSQTWYLFGSTAGPIPGFVFGAPGDVPLNTPQP